MAFTQGAAYAVMAEAVLPGTPDSVISLYASLAEQARKRTFGLIEQDVVVLDTETTGLSWNDNELIEIAAARLRGREVVERFDTFVHPSGPIPPEITELTSITNADVAHAPSAVDAVAQLVNFVGGCPIIAHNAAFDRAFITAVPGGDEVTEMWIDSLALSRIALPRLASHKLSTMADLFGCASVSHRASDDVDALCGVWRVLLCGLAGLPAGLTNMLAGMHPDVPWAYRPIFSYLAGEHPEARFNLVDARSEVLRNAGATTHVDASTIERLRVPSRDDVQADFAPGGLVSRLYEEYEPRSEQVQMAVEVRDALASSTHRVIEAGTGVGKSIAYLVPFARTAKANQVTMGIATKSNNLADQLMYHELPRLAREIEGGLSYCALKGYDHYPCLRKLERLAHGRTITTNRDPADTLTAIAVIYAFACQSPTGDLDALGIRWRSVNKPDLTTGSHECGRTACPFFPDRCFVHGARRRAANADIVVTNHSLLLRNVAAEGNILPPIRHWVIDEAHSFEREGRRQWAVTVSADDTQVLFQRLGSDTTGALGRFLAAASASEAARLYIGLGAKASASAKRAADAMAEVFTAVRGVASRARAGAYANVNKWIDPELRSMEEWGQLEEAARPAIDALEEAAKHLRSIVEAVDEKLRKEVDEVETAARQLGEMADALRLIMAGDDERYVYSCQVNRRLKAGGEMLSAEFLDIGEEIADRWFPEVQTCIFSSATMAVADTFDHFDRAVGLNRLPRGSYRALHLDSSYDFERNMSVVVASDIPEPNRRDAYLDALERLLVDVHQAMGGSTLTLFTNRRDMEDLYHRVKPRLAAMGLPLACQLSGSSQKRLREEFISDREASLFALKAFWEGFDAAGDTLRCVVIPKLPFASPDDPLSCERSARERSAWAKYALPDAVLEVKQAAGRLIRSSTDMGVLVLADSRLVNKGYGKKFLNSLPVEHQRIESSQVGKYLSLWRASRERR